MDRERVRRVQNCIRLATTWPETIAIVLCWVDEHNGTHNLVRPADRNAEVPGRACYLVGSTIGKGLNVQVGHETCGHSVTVCIIVLLVARD